MVLEYIQRTTLILKVQGDKKKKFNDHIEH